ncbi:response regulator [Natrinema sp. 1APR25-10V2]|uniref:hybrid sensor histidine kinase/response regulator n=1 Tax=Natrinema sp. 1APR25-10V2 TaxID=2951081 RepID=UPI002875F5FC|nr:response regulator [Natrinema sp. 1APR25-10V2]MDS0477080.1 response regulator [Natrinema sp. 1APR25-10V2]
MSDSPSGPISVLHVDDEPDFAEMVATFLEREDDRLTVDTARDIDEGLSRLDETDVDCIVSDYELPGRNGIEFLKTVRERKPDLPFILFTGKGSEEVASDAISAGVSDYLQKETGTDQYTLLANRIVNSVTRTRAEQARQRHLQAIETSQGGISILDENGEFIYVNEAYAELYGYDRQEILGERWELLYPDENVEAVREEILPYVASEGYWRGETTGLRADGSTFLEDHTLAITEKNELVCTVLDVSRQKKHERAIKELHSTAQAFMQAETEDEVAQIAVNAVRDILEMPANGLHLYDESEKVLIPIAWTDRTEELVGKPPAFEPGEGLAWKAFETGEPYINSDISTDPDRFNPETPIQSQFLLPLDDHGVHLIGSPDPNAFDETDVSLASILATHATTALDRVEDEQELARKNERLETFTSIVSHDLKSPLSVAIGSLEMAQEECECPYLDDAEQALDRTATLLEDLHAFAQAGTATIEFEKIDLGQLCESCWHHVETGDATLHTPTQHVIRGDRSRLQELLENLVRNAVEHGGKDVTITVGDLETGFYVEDDGSGIPATEHDRIFERGYSTTEDNTGFGLAIVQELVEIHGWNLHLSESECSGARFEITDIDIIEARD